MLYDFQYWKYKMSLPIAIPVKTQLEIFLICPILEVNGRVEVGKTTNLLAKRLNMIVVLTYRSIQSY